MLSSLESGLGELKVVSRRRADDDQVDSRVSKQLLVVGIVLDVGVVVWC